MPDPTNPAGAAPLNTDTGSGNTQPGGNTNTQPGGNTNTQPGGNTNTQPGGNTVPYDRFAAVNKAKAEAERKHQEALAELEKLRTAAMSEDERKAAELKDLQEKAKQAGTYESEIQRQKDILAGHAKAWLSRKDDAQKQALTQVAKGLGLGDDDVAAFNLGMQLEAYGDQLSTIFGTTTPPQKLPPTHSGQPGGGGNNLPDPETAEGARALFKMNGRR